MEDPLYMRDQAMSAAVPENSQGKLGLKVLHLHDLLSWCLVQDNNQPQSFSGRRLFHSSERKGMQDVGGETRPWW